MRDWERAMLAADWPARAHDELTDRLWVGGVRWGDPAPGEFDAAFTLVPRGEHRGGVPRGTRNVRFPLRDADDGLPPTDVLLDLVAGVVDEHRRGRRVLVRCYAGINRGPLVAGLAMTLLTGMSGADVVAHVRAVRDPVCLINPTFRAALEAVPARTVARAPVAGLMTGRAEERA